jgi:hypothetical protein
MNHSGQCHCGAIRIELVTEKPLAPRACQCSFCRKHNARTVADPDGAAVLTLGPETVRYRFASRAADYLICGGCGVYIGAAAEIGGQLYATLNLNAFADPRLDLAGAPVSYDGEDAEAKAGRRRQNWTPARIT